MLRRTSLGCFLGYGAIGLFCLVVAWPVAAEEEPTLTAPTEMTEPVIIQQPILLPDLASDTREGAIELEPRSFQDCIRRDEAGRFLGWMDYQHCVFSGRTMATALWFDDLFGDWHDQQASMYVSAITELALEEGGMRALQVRLRASAYLPNAKKRLRLVLTDVEDDIKTTSNTSPRKDKQSAALRWLPNKVLGFQSDVDVGVRGVNPPDIFARWRFRQQWPLWNEAIFQVGQSFRYGSESQGSSITQLDIEQVLGSSTVARIGSMYAYRQEDQPGTGMTYGHGISLSHTLPSCCSVSYGVTVGGQSWPEWHQTSYGPWLVYRQKFLREWLFWEIEPRITYAKSNNWEAKASIVLRLEALFGQGVSALVENTGNTPHDSDTRTEPESSLHNVDTGIQQAEKDDGVCCQTHSSIRQEAHD